MWFFLKSTGYELRGGYFTFKTKFLEPFPLPKLTNLDDEEPLVKRVDALLVLNKNLEDKKQTFLKRLQSNFELDKLSKKLETFWEYDFKTLLSELKKKKITLTLKEQDEWEEYFESYQKELLELQAHIDARDNEIDKMVYELYGLTEDEISIIENN
jgi:protein tyrosine/serine phosphatase